MAGSSQIDVIRPDNPVVEVVARKQLVEWDNVPPPYSSRQRLQSNAGLVAHALNVAFWASLAHEEGRPVKSSITIASPTDASEAFQFDKPLEFSHENVVRLGIVAGIESHIAVHEQDGAIKIWGLARKFAPYCVTAWFDRPGRLVASLNLGGSFDHYVLGVVEHGRVDLPSEHLLTPGWNVRRHLGHVLVDLFSPELIVKIAFLANEAYRHGHGGTLLVVPDVGRHWEHDLVIRFRLAESSQTLPGRSQSPWPPASATSIVRQVADFSRIDGALVVTSELNVIGFGAHITTDDSPEIRLPIKTRSVFTMDFSDSSWDELGGTRHHSAARFVANNRGTAAFVSSSDGRLSLLVRKDDAALGQRLERLTGLETFIPPG